MSAATRPINTKRRAGKMLNFPAAAATILYAGTIVALNSSGQAVPAADTSGLRVVGVTPETVDNSAGSAGDLRVDVERGSFLIANSGTDAVDANDAGKLCFIEDDNTVRESKGTHAVKAGRVEEVSSAGVWVEIGYESLIVPSADTITGAADLAALKTAALAIFQAHGLVI
jgi:hypothetical protein